MIKAAMTKAQAKPRMAESRPGATVAQAPASAPVPSTPTGDAPMDDAMQRRHICDFIRAMSAELSVLSHKNGLEDLAMIFEKAREAAEAEAEASTRPRETY